MPLDQNSAATAIREVLDRLVATQRENIAAAAALIVEALAAGGVVQAFGTGHSEALAMEVAGRAGGLVPTNRLALRDILIYGGKSVAGIDGKIERDPQIAHDIYELANIQPADIFVIASNSGGNGSTVELAALAKENGHKLIVLTSMEHTGRITSRHPSGKKLYEFGDVVIDNCAPYGDSLLPLPDGGSICAVSSMSSALAVQLMNTEIVARQLAAGVVPPIYLSANIPGGDTHNDALEALYAGRIRRGLG